MSMSGSKTLMLLRHAKSSWPEMTSDHERPLNGRGERDARRLGHLLRGLEHPELIVGSNARRVRQTLDGLLSEADYEGDVLLTPRLYLTSPREYLAELARAAACVAPSDTLSSAAGASSGVATSPGARPASGVGMTGPSVSRAVPGAREASRVMLVGHNPTLEELLAALTGAGLEPLPTGTLVVLSSTAQRWEQLAEARATRVAVYRARELPDAD